MRRGTVLILAIPAMAAALAASAFAPLPIGKVGLDGAESRSLDPAATLEWLRGITDPYQVSDVLIFDEEEIESSIAQAKALFGEDGIPRLEDVLAVFSIESEITVTPESCEPLVTMMLQPTPDWSNPPREMAMISKDWLVDADDDSWLDDDSYDNNSYWGTIDALVVRSGSSAAGSTDDVRALIGECNEMELNFVAQDLYGGPYNLRQQMSITEIPFDIGAENQLALNTEIVIFDDESEPEISYVFLAMAEVDDYTFFSSVSVDSYTEASPDTLDSFYAIDFLDRMIRSMEIPLGTDAPWPEGGDDGYGDYEGYDGYDDYEGYDGYDDYEGYDGYDDYEGYDGYDD